MPDYNSDELLGGPRSAGRRRCAAPRPLTQSTFRRPPLGDATATASRCGPISSLGSSAAGAAGVGATCIVSKRARQIVEAAQGDWFVRLSGWRRAAAGHARRLQARSRQTPPGRSLAAGVRRSQRQCGDEIRRALRRPQLRRPASRFLASLAIRASAAIRRAAPAGRRRADMCTSSTTSPSRA